MEETSLTVTMILDGLQRELEGRNRERDDREPNDVSYWAMLLKDRAEWILEVSQHDKS